MSNWSKMRKVLLVAVLVVALALPSDQGYSQLSCQFDPRCFRYSIGCTLVNASPYERSPAMSCEECLDSCLKQQAGRYPYICRSAVYDSNYRTCDLFAVNSMTAPQHLTKMAGRSYFQPTGLCQAQTTPAPTYATAAPSECPPDQTSKLVAIKNYNYAGLAGTTVSLSADACAQACIKNKMPDGSSFQCKAAQYTPENQCLLATQGPSNVEDTVKPSDGAVFYQKLCFPTSMVGNCPDVFEEYPQMILIGQNKQTVDASSLAECLQKCLNSQALYGFACKSGMYFYQDNTINCILNEESKSTKPEVFAPANYGDRVTYFEPGCNGGVRLAMIEAKIMKTAPPMKDQPMTSNWALWSPCDSLTESTKQYRFKQCMKSDPRKCDKEERSCSFDMKPIIDDMLQKEMERLPSTVDDNQSTGSIDDGNAKETFTPCRATFRNGEKNCTLGLQSVDGKMNYCSQPIDC